MPGSRSQPKYLRILQELLQEIRALQPGRRITGVTSLAKRFGVARATAERVLNELARQGWVRQVPGSGTYVADRRAKRVAVLTHSPLEEPSAFYTLVVQELMRQLEDQGHDAQLLCRLLDGSEPDGPSLDRVRQLEADAYATIGIMNTPYLEELAKLGGAIVATDYQPMSVRVDSVAVASMRCGYLATRALMVAGRSRVCYLGFRRMLGSRQQDEEVDSTAQRIGFERAHAETGLAVPRERIIIAEHGRHAEALQPLLDGPESPDGVVCFADGIASQVCQRIRATGRTVPEDVAVVACGGQKKDVSLFLVDPVEMGRIGARMLSERLSWPSRPARDYLIWPDYYDGKTVPPAATEYLQSVLQTPNLDTSKADKARAD